MQAKTPVLLMILKVTCRLLDVNVVTFVQKFVSVQHVQIQMKKRNYMMYKTWLNN